MKSVLDAKKLERVLAWGHPDGLEAGRNEKAWRQMNALIPKSRCLGADIMRIVASSLMFRNEPHAPQIKASVMPNAVSFVNGFILMGKLGHQD